jgi:hypothetical protein
MLPGTTNDIEAEDFTHGWRDDCAFAMHGSQRGHSTAWAQSRQKNAVAAWCRDRLA